MYKITLKIGDQISTSDGETALEAIQSLAKPKKIMGKGIFTISNGGKTRTILMLPMRIKRLFYPNTLHILAKTLSLGL